MAKSLEILESELEAAREAHRITGEAVTKAYDAYEKALTKHIEASEFDAETLVKHAHNNRAAHKQADEYVQSLGLWKFGYWSNHDDAPEDFYGYVAPEFLPKPDADMSKIADGIREFVRVFQPWCLNKDGEIFLDYLEDGLSLRASYSVMWKPETDEARSVALRYGHEDIERTGTLLEILTYVQKAHPYGANDRYMSDDEDDD